MPDRLAHRRFRIQTAHQPVALLRRQPRRLRRSIRQHEQAHDPKQDRRQPLKQEQPLPPAQAKRAVELQQRHRERRADEGRQRDRYGEGGQDARAVLGRQPVGQVQDCAGEKSGLRRTEDEAHRVERVRPDHERHAGRDQPPADHDPGDPAPGADLLQRQVARHFDQEVGDEEQAGTEAEHGGRQSEILVHLQRRKPDVDPVE